MNQIKCSQSMSSLESPAKYWRTPEGNKKPSKLCYSLSSKKPRRTFDNQMWRRSWASYEETTDPAEEEDAYLKRKCQIKKSFAINMDEIMDQENGLEMNANLRQFLEDYAAICDWLNSVQVERGRFADVEKLSELGTELVKRQSWRFKINQNAGILLETYPNLKEECGWRIRHINSQWNALEKILLCQSPANDATEGFGRIQKEKGGIEWLRDWLHKMESQIQPLDFRTQWTSELLQYQIWRHKELQKEIEEKSIEVHESLRRIHGRRKDRLEKRWWQLRLRILEWVQHLGGVKGRLESPKKCIQESSNWSSDDESAEPLNKYRRLGVATLDSEGLLIEAAMGESQQEENEGCYNRTPLSTSVEFIFEEDPTTTLTNSQSTNTKRKLPSRLNFNFNEFQQNNISTYYFKHEQESHPVAVTPASVNLDPLQDNVGGGDQSGEEEDSRVEMSEDTKKPLVILEKEIEELVLRAEELTRRRAEIVGGKKSGRIKKWVTSGAGGGMRRKKTTSSCDASAESTTTDSSDSCSEDPSTTSTVLLQQAQPLLRKCSSTSTNTLERAFIRKRPNRKPRPKSFTESSNRKENFRFISSDTALNLLECSPSSDCSEMGASRVIRRRHKRRSTNDFCAQEKETLPNFQISGPVSQPSLNNNVHPQSSDISMNSEQDWDSYQEKYLSEPYSEEPYDANDTLKLLAFGEDYDQYLERSESSDSVLSGYGPQTDSEFYKSNAKYNCLVQFLSTSEFDYLSALKTCSEQIHILKKANKSRQSQKLLKNWHHLQERIHFYEIKDEMEHLKQDFCSFSTKFQDLDPFNADDLDCVRGKIEYVLKMLEELKERKEKVQSLNESTLASLLFFRDEDADGFIKEQLQELYKLYEENFQLGTYLLQKMLNLQSAWEKFEAEKIEFERSLLNARNRKKVRLCSSTDSGLGTDASISDSDYEFKERTQKLENLKKQAFEIKSFLPPGSPVVDVIEMRLHETEKGLEDLKSKSKLKIIYPKKRKSCKDRRQENKTSPTVGRKWKVVRRMVVFNFALMGLFLVAAYLLTPKCCEFKNTFCFSLQLKHDSAPPI